MQIYVYWADFMTAITELLGYSYRNPGNMAAGGATPPFMQRILPWQHPYFNQMFVKAITHVQGMRLEGTNSGPLFGGGGGVGGGVPANLGPWSEWNIVKLTLQFWRPPYFVRNDASITIDGFPFEWLRYIDNDWQVSSQMLSKGQGSFKFVNGLGSFPGQVGQVISHGKLSKRWYDIPGKCLFDQLPIDGSCVGLPSNILYTKTATTNPITNTTGVFTYPAGSPMLGCVNSPFGGGVTDTESLRFFGMRMGTLRLDGVDFIPKPLQLPPTIMKIPVIAGTNEPIAQQQYDVVFHFDYFDPPSGEDLVTFPERVGHNLMPCFNNNLWLAVRTVQNAGFVQLPPYTTPFQYAVFQDMFRSL